MPRKSNADAKREEKIHYLQIRLQAHRELFKLLAVHLAAAQGKIIDINEQITALQVKGIK